jgi:nucleotide-binding universal stress UspA family protein
MSGANAQPLLVAVDFSVHSEAAFDWAARAARAFGSPLIVLHVVHDPGYAPGYYARSDDEGRTRLHEDVAAEMMEDFVRRGVARNPELFEAGPPPTRLVVGLPATRVLEVAEEVGARSIVVGSQGRTGLAHAMLGSKAERVAQLSPIPVTIVKAPA